MTDNSMKKIFERSKVALTQEDRARLRTRAAQRELWLKSNYVDQRVIVRIEKAKIDDINHIWNVINKYQKEQPFKSEYYEGEVKIIRDYPLADGVHLFTLDVPYYGGFGILGRIFVQPINAVQANIEVKTMADLIPGMDQDTALNLYYDARTYLINVARFLKRLYSDEETKVVENRDPEYKSGRPKYIGYDITFKKMKDDGLTMEEAFSFWKKTYPMEYKNSHSPLDAFYAAMKRRQKNTKR